MKCLAIVAIIFAIACGSKPASVAKSYKIFGNLEVTLSVPGDWVEELDKSGEPSFKAPGADSPFDTLFLRVIHCPDDTTDDAACGPAAVKLNYDGTPKTEPGAGGSFWVSDDADVKGHKQSHLRRFWPDVKQHQVLMCGAILSGADSRFAPEVRKACDTLAVR